MKFNMFFFLTILTLINAYTQGHNQDDFDSIVELLQNSDMCESSFAYSGTTIEVLDSHSETLKISLLFTDVASWSGGGSKREKEFVLDLHDIVLEQPESSEQPKVGFLNLLKSKYYVEVVLKNLISGTQTVTFEEGEKTTTVKMSSFNICFGKPLDKDRFNTSLNRILSEK